MILVAGGAESVLTVAASRGYDGGRTGAEIPLGQGVLGVAARRRRIVRMGNVATQRAYLAGVRARTQAAGQATLEPVVEMPGLADAQSQLAIPLIVKDRLVGVLGVESATANAFDELDEMLLSIVGNQVATGIDNARMHLNAIERSRQLDAVNAELSRLNETLEASVQARTSELSAALDQVRREKGLSETLLRRMAPPEVIPLMLQDRLLAQRLDVAVMFTDVVDFTAYSWGWSPTRYSRSSTSSSAQPARSSGAIAATSTRPMATASWRCSVCRSRARPTKRMPCSRRWRFSARLARSFRSACASALTRVL